MALSNKLIALTRNIQQQWAHYWANRPDESPGTREDLIEVLRELTPVDAAPYSHGADLLAGRHADYPGVVFLADENDLELVFICMTFEKKPKKPAAAPAGPPRPAPAELPPLPPEPEAPTPDELWRWLQDRVRETRAMLTDRRWPQHLVERRITALRSRMHALSPAPSYAPAGAAGAKPPRSEVQLGRDREHGRVRNYLERLIALEPSEAGRAALARALDDFANRRHWPDDEYAPPAGPGEVRQ